MTDTLRGCIIAEPGYTFISLDASQIELRVLAYESGDPAMLADLETGDLHQATAYRMRVDRYHAKQGNFANVYDSGDETLAVTMGCDVASAIAFKEAHKATYPRLYEWKEEVKAAVKQTGFVVNRFGRIRPIEGLHAVSFRIRQHAEREIVNTLVQGTAVDIVKLAMLYLRAILDRRIRLVLQVHDEMLWECPNDLVGQAIERCKTLPDYFPQYPFTMKVGTVYNKLEGV